MFVHFVQLFGKNYYFVHIQVGVTVHTPGDPDKAVSVTTAAALAESAKKLAQEAASFIDEEQEVGLDHEYRVVTLVCCFRALEYGNIDTSIHTHH